MRYQYRYHRAKREAKIFLDYLREPPGQANFFYTTSASLPAGRPNTTFNGAILLLTSTFKKHCKNHTHTVKREEKDWDPRLGSQPETEFLTLTSLALTKIENHIVQALFGEKRYPLSPKSVETD